MRVRHTMSRETISTGLTAAECRSYERDGILFPLDGVDPVRAAALRQEVDSLAGAAEPLRLLHLQHRWAYDLAVEPRLLDYA